MEGRRQKIDDRKPKRRSGVCAQERGFSCLGPNGPNEAGGEDGGVRGGTEAEGDRVGMWESRAEGV